MLWEWGDARNMGKVATKSHLDCAPECAQSGQWVLPPDQSTREVDVDFGLLISSTELN